MQVELPARKHGNLDRFARASRAPVRFVLSGSIRLVSSPLLGYYAAVKEAVERVMSWIVLFPRISSITTDGESVNLGDKGGFWALLRNDRAVSGFNSIPLMTISCAALQSNLAFDDIETRLPEVHRAVTDCTAISTFFHESGLRTHELEETAKSHEYYVRHLPKYFDVRFAQFTDLLLESVLRSWGALVTYTKDSTAKTAGAKRGGFLKIQYGSSPIFRIPLLRTEDLLNLS